MTPITGELFLEEVAADGVRLTLTSKGNVRAIGDRSLLDKWLPLIRAYKSDIVAALRALDRVVIELAHPQAKPVYFERNDGRIYGPARVTDLARTGSGDQERYWVIVEYDDAIEWVLSDRLRSQRQFEEQRPVIEAESIISRSAR